MLAGVAADNGAELVVFPELSLTGYEPKRAAELALNLDDACFDDLQCFCNNKKVSIGVGVPLKTASLPLVSTLLFRPAQNPLVCSKMYLHPDEKPYFMPATDSPSLIIDEPRIALAICFELSVPQHAQRAIDAGASVYIASVAKTASGLGNASQRLSEMAAESSMLVLMANCLGQLDGEECIGTSSVWGRNGVPMAQLDNEHEGVIIVDSESEETFITTP